MSLEFISAKEPEPGSALSLTATGNLSDHLKSKHGIEKGQPNPDLMYQNSVHILGSLFKPARQLYRGGPCAPGPSITHLILPIPYLTRHTRSRCRLRATLTVNPDFLLNLLLRVAPMALPGEPTPHA